MTHARRPYRTIDSQTAEEIVALHKKHPRLGHHGLIEQLRREGHHVDPEELERFMNENRIEPRKPWRPWHWRGPSWPFGFGG